MQVSHCLQLNLIEKIQVKNCALTPYLVGLFERLDEVVSAVDENGGDALRNYLRCRDALWNFLDGCAAGGLADGIAFQKLLVHWKWLLKSLEGVRKLGVDVGRVLVAVERINSNVFEGVGGAGSCSRTCCGRRAATR